MNRHQDHTSGLVRGIRRWDLVALFINGVIGAGIFGLPATVYRLTGTCSLLAYAICAFLVVLIVLCFAELGSRFNETGGPYLYTRRAFGPIVGFEVGWLLWLARLTAFAALCNLFVQYLAYFVPVVADPAGRAITITLIVLTLTTVNIVGVRASALVGDVFTVAKLIPLVLFAVAGLCFMRGENFLLQPTPTFADLSKAVRLLVFAFSGFEVPVITAGETRDPQRHVPFALLTAMSVVVVLYVLIQVVCIGTLGPNLGDSQRPLADACSTFVGRRGAVFMSAGALISIAGTMNSIMLAGPRLLFAMSEQRQLPNLFAWTQARFRTPYVAILVSALVTLALTLFGTFLSALTISTITRLIAYAATCAALPVLRRSRHAPTAQFQLRAGMAIAVAALVLCAWLLSNSSWFEVRAVLAAGLAGLAMHIIFRLSTDLTKASRAR